MNIFSAIIFYISVIYIKYCESKDIPPIFENWTKSGNISAFDFYKYHLDEDLKKHIYTPGSEDCSICLHMVHIISEKFVTEMPRISKMSGSKDILINNTLEESSVCDYAHWQSMEKKIKSMQITNMMDTCKEMLDMASEELESRLSKYKGDFIDLQAHICKKVYKYCTEIPDASTQMEPMSAAVLNSKISNDFLKWNKETHPHITETSTGLQYYITEKSDNADSIYPTSADKVFVDYRGFLLNGTEFDSSYQRDAPVELSLDQVISGWTEGIQLIKEKETILLFIPPHLGYSYKGGGIIGPNEALIFEVTLRVVNASGDSTRDLQQFDPEVAEIVEQMINESSNHSADAVEQEESEISENDSMYGGEYNGEFGDYGGEFGGDGGDGGNGEDFGAGFGDDDSGEEYGEEL